MPAEKITFRCFQCQKLLGISPSRAGTVVACPKCGADLIVPESDAAIDPPASEPDPAALIRSLITTDPPPIRPAPEPAGPTFPPISTGPIAVHTDPAPSPPPIPPVIPPIREEPPPDLPDAIIRPEPPASLLDRGPAARRNDVVLPRTAVVLWSFFVLLALVLAFGAGLLAGHYVWTRGPSASAAR